MSDAMPYGAGVNQRQGIRMRDDEVAAFIASRRVATLCTFNHDGTIHAVAMWYGFLEGAVAFETKAKSQKARNLLRDQRLTCLFEAGDAYNELRGVELVGHAEFVDDPAEMYELGVSVYERYNGPYREDLRPVIEAMLHKRIVAKVVVDRTVSWDHRKLSQPQA
ncbi:MAG TPA: TIGR03618 family F420-dependent PPOX class oxidoreductase [Acidimicrobiales bacterium]|nr:TIGR03618 family F420-dependent PPOX class oxidoreductase [Acidimicrobiales bacterium]